MDELHAGVRPTLAVLPQPPVFLQPRKLRSTTQRLQYLFAVRHLGGGHRHRVRQPLRVHRDVALDARHLLACVIALQARRVRVRHALRVNGQERAAGVAPQFLAGRANLDFFKASSSRLPPSRAAAPGQVQHRTEHLVQVYAPGTGFSACAFQQ